MPNGGDKNFCRLCVVLDGFHAKFGHWPSVVRILPMSLEDLQSIFSPERWATIERRLRFVPDESASMIAENDCGRAFDYVRDGCEKHRSEPLAREWLGTAPDRAGED